MIEWDGDLPEDKEYRWWFKTAWLSSESRNLWIAIPQPNEVGKLELTENPYWYVEQNEFIYFIIPKKGSLNK